LSGFEMVRHRRRDEVHARDEAASRPKPGNAANLDLALDPNGQAKDSSK
jgi:hypothetical protein